MSNTTHFRGSPDAVITVDRIEPVRSEPARQPPPSFETFSSQYGGVLCGCAILLAIGLFLIVVLVPLSFSYIEYNQVGMKREVYGTTDTHTILTRGRHKINPGLEQLVKFDATYQQVSFLDENGQSLSVYSSNGLQFNMDVIFYYKIDQERLSQTYTQYNLGYPVQVQNIAPSVIKNTAPQFAVLDYAHNRAHVQQVIGQALEQALSEQVYVNATSTFFVITNVFYPNTTLESNLDSALAVQQNALSQSQQALQLIIQETSVLVENVLVQANITLAKAVADSQVIIQNSISQSSAIVQSANGLGIQYAVQALGLSAEDGSLNEFVQLVSMQGAQNSRVVWGITQNGGNNQPVYTLSV
jgi:hypothetical protein